MSAVFPSSPPVFRLGHSSITVTLDRYGHLFPELDDAIATSFGARFDEAIQRRGQSTVVSASFGSPNLQHTRVKAPNVTR